ncbi:hypothetical protein EIP86_006544 [Pleurotus ostreatoroseus]|nr:hypothetical protein EIP86_006544 [Pleurotus ostreatoroseus]
MATLEGKKIVVIGGSSGIGYSVAKAALLNLAGHVIVASSSKARVDGAVVRLFSEPDLQGKLSQGSIRGDVVDLGNTDVVAEFFEKTGEIDHLVITSGSPRRTIDFRTEDLGKHRDTFDIRFWGTATAAQKAKIRPGGSITFTTGTAFFKPRASYTLMVSGAGTVDALTRSLAVELAPIRVNVVCPGAIETEQRWQLLPKDVADKMLAEYQAKLPVKRIAKPAELAEAYLFLMK